MATPINGQKSKKFESVPNQVYTVFGWELKLSTLGCISKAAISYKISKVERKNRMPKFPSKVKLLISK